MIHSHAQGGRMTKGWLQAVAVLVGAMNAGVVIHAQQIPAPHETGIKFTRDSEEYASITRQMYRLAAAAVARDAPSAAQPWVVILDIDETTLDNSTYQIERAAYDQPYDPASFDAWATRRQAPAVPGVVGF